MKKDDPEVAEFASWTSYRQFASSVRLTNRFVWSTDVDAFLRTVMATIGDRVTEVSKDSVFYRAQIGTTLDDDLGTSGYPAERMKPLSEFAREGRANPTGIAVLYLATTELTAISEVRPWIGQDVSVAQFKIQREIKLVDLSRGHGVSPYSVVGWSQLVEDTEPDAGKKETAVWIDIDNAFSRPVSHSDGASDYIPTQVLTELFKKNGFDGIVYRSQFGEKGYNVVLFNIADAEPINCAPFEVTKIDITFKETGNRWFKK